MHKAGYRQLGFGFSNPSGRKFEPLGFLVNICGSSAFWCLEDLAGLLERLK